MTRDGALRALGASRARWEVVTMVKALRLHSWLNTAEENDRLRAGQWALRNWSAYVDACNHARNKGSK